MRRRWTVILVVGMLLATSCTSDDDDGAGGAGGVDRATLYVQRAAGAEIRVSDDGGDTLLVLHEPEPGVTVFYDRPVRETAVLSTAAFAARWDAEDVAADPPNAAIDFEGRSRGEGVHVVELTSAEVAPDLASVTYAVRGLDGPAPDLGEGVVGPVTLFVDSLDPPAASSEAESDTDDGGDLTLTADAPGEDLLASARCEPTDLLCGGFVLPTWVGTQAPNDWTIRTADLTGDGDDEILGLGDDGIEAWTWDRSRCGDVPRCGQWAPLTTHGPFADASWGYPDRAPSLDTADLDGDGRAEVYGRGATGLEIHSYDPEADEWVPRSWPGAPGLADRDGFDETSWASLDFDVFPAAVPGFAGDALMARGRSGVWFLGLAEGGEAWAEPVAGPPLSQAAGYVAGPAAASLGVAPAMDGRDGPTVYALDPGCSSTACALELWNQDDGAWQKQSVSLGGLGVDVHALEVYGTFRTVRRADGSDVIAFRHSKGTTVVSGDGSLTTDPHDLTTSNEALAIGLVAADVDGDGGDDLLGVHPEHGLWGLSLSGDGITVLPDGPALGTGGGRGWASPLVVELTDGAAVLSSNDAGPRTWSLVDGAWRRSMATYPEFTGAEGEAFASINQQMGMVSGKTVRNQYGTSSSTLADLRQRLAVLSPTGDEEAWTTVHDALSAEVDDAFHVAAHFETLRTLNDESFLSDELRFQRVFTEFHIEAEEQTVYRSDVGGMVEGVVELLSLIPEAGEVFEAAAAIFGMAWEATAPETDLVIEGTAAELEGHLTDLFEKQRGTLLTQWAEVVATGGLSAVVGEQHRSGRWLLDVEEQARVEATSLRGFEQMLWQSFSPTMWHVMVCVETGGAIPCEHRGMPTDGVGLWQTPNGERAWIIVRPKSFNQAETLTDEQRHKLFGEPEESCDTAWTLECPFDVSPSVMYQGHDGWAIGCVSPPNGLFDNYHYFSPPCDHIGG